MMGRAIDVLNEEMVAGASGFFGGLRPLMSAKSLQRRLGGDVIVSDGPYLNCGEHAGGFWVREVEALDEALAWGRKAAVACRASVEVRAFH